MSQYASDLKRMQASMQKDMTDYDPNGMKPLESGEYTMQVKAGLTRSQKTKKLMIAWIFVVAEGEALAGRKAYDNTVLQGDAPGTTNKFGTQIARGRIEDLGYVWPKDDYPALEDILSDINAKAPKVIARVVSKDRDDGSGYTDTQIRLIEVLEKPEGSAGAGAPADAPQEDAGSAAPVEDDANQQALFNICTSFGTEGITDGLNTQEMVDIILAGTNRFPEEQLTPDELATLESINPALIKRKVTTPAPTRSMAGAAPVRTQARVTKGKK